MIPGNANRPTDEANEPSDLQLVHSALRDRGGPAGRVAAEALFGRYLDKVYLWCFRYVKDHDRALDLSQEALLKAFRSLHSFREDAPFSAWLFSIARNACLSALRPVRLLWDEDADPDSLTDPVPMPDRLLEEKEGEARILEIMRSELEPHEQDALWLRCIEKMPVDMITSVLEISGPSGARGLIQTARRKLRVALEKRSRERR